MTEQHPRKINILMVEDNPMDALLTMEILSETVGVDCQVDTVSDGAEALAYLHKQDGYQNAPRPDLIILDLNLPRMHGFDFLAEIKKRPESMKIPVCILTTSEMKDDIAKAEELHADCYLLKPLDIEKFEAAFSRLTTDMLH